MATRAATDSGKTASRTNAPQTANKDSLGCIRARAGPIIKWACFSDLTSSQFQPEHYFLHIHIDVVAAFMPRQTSTDIRMHNAADTKNMR
jgi:hypothetical protein